MGRLHFKRGVEKSFEASAFRPTPLDLSRKVRSHRSLRKLLIILESIEALNPCASKLSSLEMMSMFVAGEALRFQGTLFWASLSSGGGPSSSSSTPFWVV